MNFKAPAVVLIAALLASCAGQSGNIPKSNLGIIFKVNQDPTLSLTRLYLESHRVTPLNCNQNQLNQLNPRSSPQYCNYGTPPPNPYGGWDVGFMPGNDLTGITFGPYFQNVNVAFHPSLGTCIGHTAHDLTADAYTLALSLQNAYSQWQSNAGAQQMDGLLNSYAAGEIGAAAFIAGSIDILGVAAVAGIIVGTALTIYSLVSIAECVSSGNAVGYVKSSYLNRPRTA